MEKRGENLRRRAAALLPVDYPQPPAREDLLPPSEIIFVIQELKAFRSG